MIISLIAAMDVKGGIGKNNRLPWHLPSDLKRFKKLTMGHNLVMGRKTYETIGKSLPGRVMIVVTHQLDYFPKDCKVVSSLKAAIKMAQDNHESEVFVIGGAEIFHQAIGLADRIYLTTVHTDVAADIFFPKIDLNQWEFKESKASSQYEKDDYASDFEILSRKH